ncbi:MAG TPA: flagellar motor protein MotB [Jatrophihabitans sp.]|nr:flagellar motor protein MotB [Jatrophihabitans sp.]
MSAGHGGSTGRGRSRKVHEEEHENHERWMVTYADMLTLLLVLFIVLYAISQVNTSKFAELKSSLSSAFGNGQQPVLNGGQGPIDGNLAATQDIVNSKIPSANQAQSAAQPASAPDTTAAQREVDEFTKIEKAIKASLHAKGLDGTASFNIDERGLVVTLITDELVFAGNSATLEPEGQIILSAVDPELAKIDNQIQVDGHTNQANVSTAPYPSGWELSSARASSVVRYLIARGGLSANRLSAAGYSDQRPLIDPKNPASIVRNRRVDIVVLSKLPATARGTLAALGANAAG